MKLKLNKRGQVFSQIQGLGVGIAGMVIVFAVVFLIMTQVGSNQQVAADGNATAAVLTLANATDDIPGWVPLIVIAIIGGIMLSLVALFQRR